MVIDITNFDKIIWLYSVHVSDTFLLCDKITEIISV